MSIQGSINKLIQLSGVALGGMSALQGQQESLALSKAKAAEDAKKAEDAKADEAYATQSEITELGTEKASLYEGITNERLARKDTKSLIAAMKAQGIESPEEMQDYERARAALRISQAKINASVRRKKLIEDRIKALEARVGGKE